MEYIWLDSARSHFGIILCTCLKMACNLKASCRRKKPSEVWVLRDTSRTHMGCLWLCSSQGHLGHSLHLSQAFYQVTSARNYIYELYLLLSLNRVPRSIDLFFYSFFFWGGRGGGGLVDTHPTDFIFQAPPCLLSLCCQAPLSCWASAFEKWAKKAKWGRRCEPGTKWEKSLWRRETGHFETSRPLPCDNSMDMTPIPSFTPPLKNEKI